MEVLQHLLFLISMITSSIAVRHHLEENNVARAVQMMEDGLSQRQVAERMGVSRSVIARLWRQEDTLADQDKAETGSPDHDGTDT